MDIFSVFGILLCLALSFTGAEDPSGCETPQYLETGVQGTVSCSFEANFFSVYWYNSKNYVTADAIIEYQNSEKRGKGYESGEFDVHQNGSLIINNVSLAHDHYFTAVEVRFVDNYNLHYIRVIATVRPHKQYPVIENCEYDSNVCYREIPLGKELRCFVQNARPTVALTWVHRTANGDRNLSSLFTVTSSGLLNTSLATTDDLLAFSSGLNLLVCKANSIPVLLRQDEALIIVESDISEINSFRPIPRYIKMNSRLSLSCTENEINFLVWKFKRYSDENFTATAYGVYWRNGISKYQSEGYNLTDAGAVVIPYVTTEQEGLHGCIGSNGTAETIVVYDIIVYVPPVPAYPVVEGCGPDRYCVLEVSRRGVLRCSVSGIRPKVILTWETFYETSSNEISFYNPETTVTSRQDNTFDVVLTARYDASRASQTKLTIECTISEKEIFPLTTRLDLLFRDDRDMTTLSGIVSKEPNEKQEHLSWIIIVAVIVVVIIVAFFAFFLVRGKILKSNTTGNDVEKESNVPMLPVNIQNNKLSRKDKDDFIMQLKSKYADLTAAVHPVPYLREKIYSVNDVFVDCGLEFLLSGEKWETLQSYDKIFSDPRLTSSRRIIEGEAGYGKSTLGLKLAYDWSNDVEGSPVIKKDIFIFLPLRQLKGIKSIFEAIRQCLLPKDTQFSSSDIERILQESKSSLVVLDGYDEYPDQDMGEESFVINIIKREMMQQCDVVLTTRSAYLPKDYSAVTKRIRLRGFDDTSRELYIRKVLVGEDDNAVDRIKEKMKENPFLEDICQVPLFYVLFAHLSNVKETVLKFNSVTTFFRHIISCLHSHAKNKVTDPREKKEFEIFESEHHELDKVAFEGLSGKSQQLIWEKDSICRKLSQEFYNHYIAIGVLVEEEVLHIIDDPGKFTSQHIQYRQKVRFYHKLFCEWYAAHYLASYAANQEVTLDPRNDEQNNRSECNKVEQGGSIPNDPNKERHNNVLDNLDPADVQYLYRFACGLDAIAAEKICQYVTSKYGGDKFAILCLVEQAGQLEKIKPIIQKLCESTVMFHLEHSKLLQRSTIQILEIASIQQISISHLWLCNCFERVTDAGRSLLLKSGIKVRCLHTLSALDIRENEREMTKQETVDIINYCIYSRELSTLKFKYCFMPRCIPIEEVNDMEDKKITVLWDTGFASSFILDLNNGLWQHKNGSGTLTEEEYSEEQH